MEPFQNQNDFFFIYYYMFLSQYNYFLVFVTRNTLKNLKENVLNIFRNRY